MDPATTFCPNLACPARGQAGQGNIRMHSRKDKRFLKWLHFTRQFGERETPHTGRSTE